MMHILALFEGYEHQLKETKQLLEQKYYPAINPVDVKQTYYSPAFREIKLYDIVIPEVIRDQVLKDIGFGEKEYAKKHKLPKFIRWLINIFKPKGMYYPDIKVDGEKEKLCHIMVLGFKNDLKEECGYERV